MLETLIHYHNLPDQPYSTDEFNSWKVSPVTKQILKDLSFKCLQGVLNELPVDPDQATPEVYRREGATKLTEEILMGLLNTGDDNDTEA